MAITVVILATAIPFALGVTVDAASAIATKVVVSAFAVALLTGFGWWARTGFLALPSRRDLVWLAPPALLVTGMIAAIVIAGPVPMEPTLVVAFAIVAFGAGFSEEALFRGVLIEAMRPWGLVWALIGSTMAFSVIHLAGLLAGATIEATLAQVLLVAIPFGLAFGGLRLTGRSIWPLIVIHALNNFGGFLVVGVWTNGTADAQRFGVAVSLQLGLLLVLAAYSVWFVWSLRAARSTEHAEPGTELG